MWGVAAYDRGSRIISFIILVALSLLVPVAAIAVLVFSIVIFYRSWESGNEAFSKNPYSIVLEGLSGFIFITFFMRYSYKLFLNPFLVKSIDAENAVAYQTQFHSPVISYAFSNILLLAPEFTSKSSLYLSGVVMGVIVVMGVLVRVAVKRVDKS